MKLIYEEQQPLAITGGNGQHGDTDDEEDNERTSLLRNAAIRRVYDAMAARTVGNTLPEYQRMQAMDLQQQPPIYQTDACCSRTVSAAPSEFPQEVQVRMETTSFQNQASRLILLWDHHYSLCQLGPGEKANRRANESSDARSNRLQQNNHERTLNS